MTSRLPTAMVLMVLAVSSLILAATLAPDANTSSGAAPWPMFRHDLGHTGRSQFSGPSVPTEKWSFGTGMWSSASARAGFSSPAVGSDETVYVGSPDHDLYAINPDGTKKWNFSTGGEVDSSPAIGSDGTVYVLSHDRKLYAIGNANLSTASTKNGEGIPEFPFQLVAVPLVAVVLLSSYLLVRRRQAPEA